MMLKKWNQLRFAGAAAAVLTFSAMAHAALSGIGNSEVHFRAVGPAGLKIDGDGSGLTASESNGVVSPVFL